MAYELSIHARYLAVLPVQPDQYADRANLQGTRFQVNRGKSLNDIVGFVCAVIDGPTHAAGCQKRSQPLFDPRSHEVCKPSRSGVAIRLGGIVSQPFSL